jgi:hypothetical protein
MPREVDPKRTRKAMRAVERLKRAREEGAAVEDFSQWEDGFLDEVGVRLEKYGSAFHNLSKGRPEEALSVLQTQKLKEIEAKAKGKKRKGFTTRKPMGSKRAPPRTERED